MARGIRATLGRSLPVVFLVALFVFAIFQTAEAQSSEQESLHENYGTGKSLFGLYTSANVRMLTFVQ